MKTRTEWICLAGILGFGCSGMGNEISESKPNASVAFEGKVDERFTGTWKSADGVSTYQLKKDGTYELESKIPVAGQGPIHSHLEGEWKVQKDKFLFRDGQQNVVPYAYTFEDGVLELSLTGRLKTKTVLKRP